MLYLQAGIYTHVSKYLQREFQRKLRLCFTFQMNLDGTLVNELLANPVILLWRNVHQWGDSKKPRPHFWGCPPGFAPLWHPVEPSRTHQYADSTCKRDFYKGKSPLHLELALSSAPQPFVIKVTSGILAIYKLIFCEINSLTVKIKINQIEFLYW